MPDDLNRGRMLCKLKQKGPFMKKSYGSKLKSRVALQRFILSIKYGTRDGTRTRKVDNRLILSQLRMPFRHPGMVWFPEL